MQRKLKSNKRITLTFFDLFIVFVEVHVILYAEHDHMHIVLRNVIYCCILNQSCLSLDYLALTALYLQVTATSTTITMTTTTTKTATTTTTTTKYCSIISSFDVQEFSNAMGMPNTSTTSGEIGVAVKVVDSTLCEWGSIPGKAVVFLQYYKGSSLCFICPDQHVKYRMYSGVSLTSSLLLNYYVKQYIHSLHNISIIKKETV